MTRMLLCFLLLFPIAIRSSVSLADRQPPPSCSDVGEHKSLACEVEEAKLRIVRLETILEKRIEEVNARAEYFRGLEKKVEELSEEIGRLKTVLSSFEQDRLVSIRKIVALEEEVKLLWAASRRNNFEIYNLESLAAESERKLNELSSKVEEVNAIVTEQWIQIQRLEQAVYVAKIRTLKFKEFWRKCPFIKFFIDFYTGRVEAVKEVLKPYGPKYKYMIAFCNYQASQAFAAAKDYHHQLQSFIRQTMQSNEITSALAHEEIVFFVASALVAIPIMTACMTLLQLRSYFVP